MILLIALLFLNLLLSVVYSQPDPQSDISMTETMLEDNETYVPEAVQRAFQEYLEAQQIQALVTHRITIRYKTLAASTEIGPGYCRVNYRDRIFNIHSVINPELRNIYLDLMCTEEI